MQERLPEFRTIAMKKISIGVFVTLYVLYVLAVMSDGGLPKNASEFVAIFLVPAAALTFLWLFYGGLSKVVRKSTSGRSKPDR